MYICIFHLFYFHVHLIYLFVDQCDRLLFQQVFFNSSHVFLHQITGVVKGPPFFKSYLHKSKGNSCVDHGSRWM